MSSSYLFCNLFNLRFVDECWNLDFKKYIPVNIHPTKKPEPNNIASNTDNLTSVLAVSYTHLRADNLTSVLAIK